ncbi:hypothetical protein CLIB1423_10S02234 [[Candida] railenensis]|uniref:Uncharacterized protein n=1 Tax=[Candida] railenensis TaxID=45579 RepID=A0A9P0VYV3_9ASCO|nr:hypothetical protein CLIB1423_10S02234 [[Candida] railenensis]
MPRPNRNSSISSKSTPSRSRSASIVVPTVVTPDPKRNHSLSISSVTSNESVNNDVLNDLKSQDAYKPSSKGKVHLMDDVDLEKQLILTAGGKREYVCGFVLKLLFLCAVVSGCSVLIFYAL